jgi:uncharacterized protein Yka (UPF0111/DUF47 family)
MPKWKRIPTENGYYALFTALAETLNDGSEVFKTAASRSAEDTARLLKDMEEKADEISYKINELLGIDRDLPIGTLQDLHDLTHALDDVIDGYEEAARCIFLYNLAYDNRKVQHFVLLIQKACCELVRFAGYLQKITNHFDDIQSAYDRVNTFEHEGDDLIDQIRKENALGVYEPVNLVELHERILYREVYDFLERSLNAAKFAAGFVVLLAKRNP